MDLIEFYSSFLTAADYIEALQSYKRILILSVVAYLFIYIFEAIALYTIAKRENVKHKWFAFVPFLNDYLIGELGGTAYLFSAKIKKSGLWFALADLVGTASGVFLYYCEYVVRGGSVYENGQYIETPEEIMWAKQGLEYGQYVDVILHLVYVIFMVISIVSFFRKYYPRNYMIMVFTTFFFPISKGVLMFIVRKNTGIDYQAYMRAQQEAYMRRYQQQQQQYDRNPYDPFGQRNPYDRNPYQGKQQPQQPNPEDEIDPFEEFSTKKPSSDQGGSFEPNDTDSFFN